MSAQITHIDPEETIRKLKAKVARLEKALAAQPAPNCTRSHPHENMDAMCELRTEIARLTNENARLKAQPAPVQPKPWVGLTQEDKEFIELTGGKSDVLLAELVESKLKEKNHDH
jgi:hypothetical protein